MKKKKTQKTETLIYIRVTMSTKKIKICYTLHNSQCRLVNIKTVTVMKVHLCKRPGHMITSHMARMNVTAGT